MRNHVPLARFFQLNVQRKVATRLVNVPIIRDRLLLVHAYSVPLVCEDSKAWSARYLR